MNGPRSTGPEYTGKHRRDSGPGVLPPAWPRRPESYSRPEPYSRPESYSRPAPDSRLGSGAAARPGLRLESGQWPDAR
jgi:hypothetical protein